MFIVLQSWGVTTHCHRVTESQTKHTGTWMYTMNFLNSDVPDPTDFPPHAVAPGLRDLDGSFRCDICGDLFDAPVTIVCGHCFCSAVCCHSLFRRKSSNSYVVVQCIRVSLANKQECPSCRKTASEAHIRSNPALDKVISDWRNARCDIVVHLLPFLYILTDSRPFILQLVRKADHPHDSFEEPKTAKKRKRNPSRASSTDTTVSGPSRFPSSPTRVNTSPSRQKKTKYIDMTIPSSDADEEEISIPNRSLVPEGRFL